MQMNAMTLEQVQQEQRSFMTKVYGWMTGAMVITALVASFVASSPPLWKAIVGNQILFFGLIIGELALVAGLSGWIGKMSAGTATLLFIAYSALNGLTLSVIFVAYTMQSIGMAFMVTGCTFGGMSILGYTTRMDLTSLGGLCIMALLGIIIASIANIFFHSTTLYWIVTYVGILVFVGLVAYDTQKIKRMNIVGNAGTDEDRKEAILGALALYLDFINLFLMILRLLGRRR